MPKPPTEDQDPFDTIVDAPFDSALSERYLVYALSTITARSLPDLRDGLKPVHRRLLWAMRQLKLDPTGGFKKSARVVGDVIGKYHPHGDASVYDAMVRLAQDWSLRYPLVEGQGNFGNIDGDNAAAYRYTEARLTRTAIRLMAGLDEGTVDFVPTYNGEEEEPEIFPGLFPNLLANGSTGIAVGMATSIPSHNVAEIVDATLLLIDNPHAEHAQLMEVFHGPDFATGGLAVDSPAAISAAYASGHEPLDKDYKFKDGDGPGFVLHAQTTDKLLIACDNGRFYTLGADKLPSARGFGEPLRTMVDIDSAAQIAAVVVYRPKAQLLLASNAGRGFVAEMDELLAETRKGRGVMGTKPGVQLTVVHEIPPEHDHVAVVGDNRKLVIFSLSEMPVMAKGQGVALQRYRDGGLSDATTLRLEDGLSWKMGGDSGRTRTENDLMLWKVARGAAGRMPPNGFPRDNKF